MTLRNIPLTTIRPEYTVPMVTQQAICVDYVSSFPRVMPATPTRWTPERDAADYERTNIALMMKELTERISKSMLIPDSLITATQLRR